MGGKALSNKSVRLIATRYHAVAENLISQLRAALPNRRVEIIEAYATKPDFGDLDVLIEGGFGYDPFTVAQLLQATEIVRNGDVTSIGVAVEEGIFQVDLIKIPVETFDFALRYFSYNDMGNLLGRVAHKFGAKFGHLGLRYVLRDPNNSDHLISELTITQDFSTALSLIGYDPEIFEDARKKMAFASLEDIFRFVVSSPFVNKGIFLLDNRNHAARTRDSKRKTYKSFLEWLQRQSEDSMPNYAWGATDSQERVLQQRDFLNRAFIVSPTFKGEYDSAISMHERHVQTRRYFNGKNIAALTGLSGKDLGEHMRLIRNSFSSTDEFEKFFASANEAIANQRIINLVGSKI